MVLDGKRSEECPVNAVPSQSSILGHTPFRLYTNNLPDDANCNAAIHTDDLVSKCDQTLDLVATEQIWL